MQLDSLNDYFVFGLFLSLIVCIVFNFFHSDLVLFGINILICMIFMFYGYIVEVLQYEQRTGRRI